MERKKDMDFKKKIKEEIRTILKEDFDSTLYRKLGELETVTFNIRKDMEYLNGQLDAFSSEKLTSFEMGQSIDAILKYFQNKHIPALQKMSQLCKKSWSDSDPIKKK